MALASQHDIDHFSRYNGPTNIHITDQSIRYNLEEPHLPQLHTCNCIFYLRDMWYFP